MWRPIGWVEKQEEGFINMSLENVHPANGSLESLNFETLKFERQASIGILSIHRPKALNALNMQVLDELESFMSHLAAQYKGIDILSGVGKSGEPEVSGQEGCTEGDTASGLGAELRALVLTGEGKAFVAGADIKEMQGYSESKARQMSERGQSVFQLIEEIPCPVVAAVNGFALGGGLELAMSCDFIIASSTAKMGLPEVSLGLLPGYGGTQRLSRYVGKALARRMVLTGDVYSADQLFQWGLVTEVVPPEELMEVSLKVAKTLSSRSPIAISLAKASVNRGYELSQKEGLRLEAHLFGKSFKTHDCVEGIAAFIEKRKPDFRGR